MVVLTIVQVIFVAIISSASSVVTLVTCSVKQRVRDIHYVAVVVILGLAPFDIVPPDSRVHNANRLITVLKSSTIVGIVTRILAPIKADIVIVLPLVPVVLVASDASASSVLILPACSSKYGVLAAINGKFRHFLWLILGGAPKNHRRSKGEKTKEGN